MNPLHRTTAAIVFLSVAAWMTRGAAVPAQTRGPLSPLTVAVNMTTIESAPVFLAAAELGDAVRVVAGGIPQLTSGDADLATNAETQALLRSVADPSLRIILTLAECTYRIVGRRSAGLVRVADLRGKRIATATNTSAHYFLSKILRTASLSERDVTIVSLPLAEMPQALQRGDVDAVAIWEPAAQRSIEAAGRDALVLQNRGSYREHFNLNTTVASLNDPAKRAAIVNFVRALDRASASIRRRPASQWPLVSEKINLSAQTISRTWREFSFPASLPRDLGDVMTEEEAWAAAVQQRQPRTRSAVERLIDDSIWREADAAHR